MAVLMDVLLRTSEAFFSRTSKPKWLQIIRQAEVFPMPGGPESKAAFAAFIDNWVKGKKHGFIEKKAPVR